MPKSAILKLNSEDGMKGQKLVLFRTYLSIWATLAASLASRLPRCSIIHDKTPLRFSVEYYIVKIVSRSNGQFRLILLDDAILLLPDSQKYYC